MARDRHPHLWPVPNDRPGVDAELFEGPRSRTFDHDIGRFDQLAQSSATRVRRPVERHEVGTGVQSIEELGVSATTIRPADALDLGHLCPEPVEELSGERARPERSQVHHPRSRDRPPQGRTEMFGDDPPPIGLLADDGTRQTEERRASDELGPRTRADLRLDDTPRVVAQDVRVDDPVVEPRRNRRDVVGTGERDRDPSVGGAQQAAGPAAADSAGGREPEQPGPVGQQASPIGTEPVGQRCAAFVEPSGLGGDVPPHRGARRPILHVTMFLYASGIGHIDVSTSEYRELIDGPYLDELLAGVALVIVHPDGTEDRPAPSPGSTPAVVCWAGAGDAPGWADVALDAADRAALAEQVERVPLAAISLAVLLRQTEGLSIPAALAAESAVYSMLQGGPEFAAWRAATPAKPDPEPDRSTVLIDRDGDRLLLTLDRPHRHNAISMKLRDELYAALDDRHRRRLDPRGGRRRQRTLVLQRGRPRGIRQPPRPGHGPRHPAGAQPGRPDRTAP